MPNIYTARSRHAHYYLDIALKNLDDWEFIEGELSNIHYAQEWVNGESNDHCLIKAYGELGWLLLHKTIERIARINKDFDAAIKAAINRKQLQLQTNEEAMENLQKLNEEMLEKLSDIISSQREIQANLQPRIQANGKGSFAAQTVIANTLIVGEYTQPIIQQPRSKPRQNRRLNP